MQTRLAGMKLFKIVCILLILGGTCLAEDLIFLADDHYKSLGLLELRASVTNPVIRSGDNLLRINLANTGQLEELIPINGDGSQDDVNRELKEEMHSVDALNINAALGVSESLRVTSGPQHISILRAGGVSELQFNITAENSSRGWFELPLHVDYMRQVDVSVSNGTVTPLYQSFNHSLNLEVFAAGREPLRIIGIRSDLEKGKSGAINLVIENDGAETMENCSARLLAAAPFHVEGPDILLGDLNPGKMVLASFTVAVDENARLQDYQLGCLIQSGERRMELALPLLTLTGSDNFPGSLALPIGGVILALLGAFLLLKRKGLLYGRKRRRPGILAKR